MEFRNKREETADNRAADRELYRLLVAGDLPGAWLAAKSQMEKSGTENISCAAAFNRGLCFYRLGNMKKLLDSLGRQNNPLAVRRTLIWQKRGCFWRHCPAGGRKRR